MLGILPLYFIGKYFYELAFEHNRSRWGFAILGIATYFISQLAMGFILGIILVASDTEFTGNMELVTNIAGILIGIAGVWLFYFLLKRAWEKNPKKGVSNSELLDDID